jgi:hypothetical protein
MVDNSAQVPVLRCVISAYVFLRRNLVWLYSAAAIYLVLSLLRIWLALVYTKAESLTALAPLLGIILIPVMVMVSAAYLRKGLGMATPGMMGLQVGADEMRLFLSMFAVGGITAFILFIGTLAGLFALSAVITSVVDPAIIEAEPASAFAHAGATGLIAAIVVGIGLFALGIYTLARFSPAYPAVIAEGRVVVFEAANWSKGQGWRMALAITLTSLPFYLILLPGMVQHVQFVMANMPSMGAAPDTTIEVGKALPSSLLWYFIALALLWPARAGALNGLYVTFYRGLKANQHQTPDQ